jgi:catechol 2,3-dioxygenase-like lactoylglutathione lyase family enzyme
MELEALDHVGPAVSAMARSVRWYAEVSGLRRAHEEAGGELPAVLGGRRIGGSEGDDGLAWSGYLPDPDGCQVEITTYEPAT